MYKRLNNLTISDSFFLFGARGTGKSTLIRHKFAGVNLLEIDLLDPVQAEEALLGLSELKAKMEYAVGEGKWIFVDEVQIQHSQTSARRGKFTRRSCLSISPIPTH